MKFAFIFFISTTLGTFILRCLIHFLVCMLYIKHDENVNFLVSCSRFSVFQFIKCNYDYVPSL